MDPEKQDILDAFARAGIPIDVRQLSRLEQELFVRGLGIEPNAYVNPSRVAALISSGNAALKL